MHLNVFGSIVPIHYTQAPSTIVLPASQSVHTLVATVPLHRVHFLVASGKVSLEVHLVQVFPETVPTQSVQTLSMTV